MVFCDAHRQSGIITLIFEEIKLVCSDQIGISIAIFCPSKPKKRQKYCQHTQIWMCFYYNFKHTMRISPIPKAHSHKVVCNTANRTHKRCWIMFRILFRKCVAIGIPFMSSKVLLAIVLSAHNLPALPIPNSIWRYWWGWWPLSQCPTV